MSRAAGSTDPLSEFDSSQIMSTRLTDEQRADAVRAITHRAAVEQWTVAESRQALDILGLLPPTAVTGPMGVVCPLCSAAAGSRCITTGSRTKLAGGLHKARQEAA